MPAKKKPARKAASKSADHLAVEALCDKHITVTPYEGSDETRRFVLTDNYGPVPSSCTVGDGEDAATVVARLKSHRDA